MREQAKIKIKDLVERFRSNLDVYKKTSYNETQLRREYIDPLFEALGWDVANMAGYAEQYKDVVHEDAIKIGVSSKAPDYSFRIGGQRKFFLEAKKPSVNIKDDASPAYQLRRYAWSAKLPLSILTDFEELAIYDCRIKPNPNDNVATGRVAYYTFEQYVEKFDEIYGILSKESVLKGSFDRYIVSSKGKRGTAEVDKEFLKEIESWRDSLAKNIALRNEKLTVKELNFAVQQTIDRIIFLRICEDRGIETYGRLLALQNGGNVYKRLMELFYSADKKYNSGLFDFTSDKLSHTIGIDDKVLKELIGGIYYPNSPYEFSVLGADILGNVYEQFLGKVIRLTAGHTAKVDEKPEVKKAGGVYYTPVYIVDYIVKNTVEKLLTPTPPSTDPSLRVGSPGEEKREKGESNVSSLSLSSLVGENASFSSSPQRGEGRVRGKLTPKEISNLRILDPACGSGSFLIGAYQYLLDYHLNWYRENEPEKHAKGKKPVVYKGHGGEWRLTTTEKKRILLNNIFGVDIDRQAVEVTKLSLLLKVLEGENEETLGKTFALFQERALPNLESNIKCGNSLIGPDFYDTLPLFPSNKGRGENLSPLVGKNASSSSSPLGGEGRVRGKEGWDDEEADRINVFDWNDDEKGFGKIMKDGGFDCVIGNPPYVVISEDIYPEPLVDYFRTYSVTQYKADLFHLFIQRSIELLAPNGRFGYIVPNPWLTQKYTEELRKFILSKVTIFEVVVFDHFVFQSANVHTALIFIENRLPEAKHKVRVKKPKEEASLSCIEEADVSLVPQQLWSENEGFRFETRLLGNHAHTVTKILKNWPSLKSVARASLGCQAYNKSKHTAEQIANRVFHAKYKAGKDYLPELAGKDIDRYIIEKKRGEWIKYGAWLHDYRTMDWLQGPRILIREITGVPPYQIRACYVEETYCNYKTILNVNPSGATDFSMKYLLGLLNSKLLSFLYPYVSNKIVSKSFPRLSVGDVRQLPIRAINFKDKKDKSAHDKMVSLVDNMLELNKKLPNAKTPHERELLERQIKIIDNQIDRLVYELYALTEEEIKVVEGEG